MGFAILRAATSLIGLGQSAKTTGQGVAAETAAKSQNAFGTLQDARARRASQAESDRTQRDSALIQQHGMNMLGVQNAQDIRAIGQQQILGQLKEFAGMHATASGKTMDKLSQLVK